MLLITRVTFTPLFICFIFLNNIYAQCSGGEAENSLELNQEDIFFNNLGNLGSTFDPDVISYPFSQLRLSPQWAGGFWLGGINENNSILLNAATFQGFGNNCFWPGPYDNNNVGNFSDPDLCQDWDILFKVDKKDIDAFKQDFADNGELNNPIPESIRGWPARRNPFFMDIHGFSLPNTVLAPFIDINGNGIYNPIEGDYPNINDADQGVWWVMQTNGHINVCTGSDNLNVEIHILAHTYNEFDQSTFYDIDIISMDEQIVDSLFFSYWLDCSSLCAEDLIGSMPEEDFAFFYGNDESSNQCAGSPNLRHTLMGVKQLKGPLAPRIINSENELVYPDISIEADTFVEQRLSSVKHYYRFSPTTELFEADPQTTNQYYNLMQGKWRDGSDQIINGIVNPFAFPGNPSNQEENDYAMCNEEERIEDIRLNINCGPFRMQPGSTHRLSYVVTRVDYDNVRCADVNVLGERIEEIENFYRNFITTSAHPVLKSNNNVFVQPNPARDIVSFALDEGNELIEQIEIFDLSGKSILNMDDQSQSKLEVSIASLNAGTYFYVLISDKSKGYSGKFIKL